MSQFTNGKSVKSSKRLRYTLNDDDDYEEDSSIDNRDKHINDKTSRAKKQCIRTTLLTPDQNYEIDDEWVSATSTKNYLMKDPLMDWLSYHYSACANKTPKLNPLIMEAVRDRDDSKDANCFAEFLMNQGKEFEKGVYALIFKKFDSVIDLGGDTASHSRAKFRETINAMKQGTEIICNAVLHDPETRTYGIADIIIRSDKLRKLIKMAPITREAERVKAPLCKGSYHYCVIDVKWMTLVLRSNGINLLNSGNIPAYKGQLYIYNSILSKIQGYNPQKAFILGRKWKFTSKGCEYAGPSCLERLGIIDFEEFDKEYPQRTEDAVNWIRDMRANGENWDLTTLPLARPELYPNMSNKSDYPWHEVKTNISKAIGEITELWMCGPKQRIYAHNQGVYAWTDEKCNVDTLGIQGEKRRKTLSAILDINQKPGKLFKVKPRFIKNNERNWQDSKGLDFYVDFENLHDVIQDFSVLPRAQSISIIFMIGLRYYYQNEWKHHTFIVNNLTLEEEKRICREFSQKIQQIKDETGSETARIFHWSGAEPRVWDDAAERHRIADGEDEPDSLFLEVNEDWFDLLELFRNEPIVVRNCMCFSLKEIAGALYRHGLIKTTWDLNNPCSNGPLAMVLAYKAANEAKRRFVDLSEMPAIRQIAQYNLVDCQVLQEIVDYLRQHHTSMDDEIELIE